MTSLIDTCSLFMERTIDSRFDLNQTRNEIAEIDNTLRNGSRDIVKGLKMGAKQKLFQKQGFYLDL